MTLKELLEFREMWNSWIGVGLKPTPKAEAERRADICRACPMNKRQGWDERIKKMATQTWMRFFAEKTRLHMHVPDEKELHLCQVCQCVLQLKIWVPEQTIRESTTEENYPENCWIPPLLKETKP